MTAALDVDHPKPPGAHDLGDAASIVAIGLVPHRLQGRLHLPCFDADHGEARGAQAGMEPWRYNAPASRPTRLKVNPALLNAAAIAAGWLATLFSTTILPSLSTMQMLVCSNDTSSPAKYSMAVLHP